MIKVLKSSFGIGNRLAARVVRYVDALLGEGLLIFVFW
jgi:hypothetical protein